MKPAVSAAGVALALLPLGDVGFLEHLHVLGLGLGLGLLG